MLRRLGVALASRACSPPERPRQRRRRVSRTRVRTSTTPGAGRPPRRGWSRPSCAAVQPRAPRLDDQGRGVLQRPQGHRRRADRGAPARRPRPDAAQRQLHLATRPGGSSAGSAATSRRTASCGSARTPAAASAATCTRSSTCSPQTGTTRWTTMIGSANLTGNGVKIQWNDMYTVNANRADVRRLLVSVFKQMKQRPAGQANPFRTATVRGAYDDQRLPALRHARRSDDPMHEAAGPGSAAAAAKGATGIGNRDADPHLRCTAGTACAAVYLAEKIADAVAGRVQHAGDPQRRRRQRRAARCARTA